VLRGGPSSVPDPVARRDLCRVQSLSTAFPRTHRLLAGAEYSRVFGGADRSSDRFFTVLAKLNELPTARLGLAVARRVAPRAVDRNRLRRLAREAFRQLELAPLDYVVMAKKEAVTAANSEIRSSLDRHFSRLSLRVTQN
jgi:ribonuclease P protein component